MSMKKLTSQLFFPTPAGFRRLFGNFFSPFGRHTLGSSFPTHAAEFHSGPILTVVNLTTSIFLNLASSNSPYHDGSADHIGGPLFAFGAFGHLLGS
jgi:hypothetical protein